MLKNTDDQMDALELAEKAKTQNIIDMAVGFTAMMPLFQERSADLIKEKLADLLSFSITRPLAAEFPPVTSPWGEG